MRDLIVNFGYLGLNCFNYKSFEDPKTVWTPFVSINSSHILLNTFFKGNESIKNRDRATELYKDPIPENMTQEEYDKQ